MAQDYLQSKDYSIGTVLTDFRPFYIPIFQRPYSWGKTECQKLWEDIVDFFVTKEPYKVQLADAPKYFLGALVVYQDGPDETKRMAVIDGQQRITTLMLLLKVFYDILNPITDRKDNDQQKAKEALERIEKSLWTLKWSDEADGSVPQFDKPILQSDAIDDEDAKNDFLNIITAQTFNPESIDAKKNLSSYLENYLELKGLIDKSFAAGGELATTPKPRFVNSILDYCTVLFIKSQKEEDALRIFNTLNNRGMQLLDADILKSQLYQETPGDKSAFKDQWATFSILAQRAKSMQPSSVQPQDEMFRMIMMLSKASLGNSENDIQLRTYFEKKSAGGGLINDRLLEEKLIPVSAFFAAMANKFDPCADAEDVHVEPAGAAEAMYTYGSLITDEAFKWIHVVRSFNKNTYWRHLVAVFFLMHWNDGDFESKFEALLKKAIAFNILYLIYDIPFTNIRRKAYELLIEIYNNGDFSTDNILNWSADGSIQFDYDNFAAKVEALRVKPNFSKALTLLHAYLNPNQSALIPVEAQVEHIFPRSWEKHVSADDQAAGIYGVTDADIREKYVEKFGNKVMLEAVLNNGAKDKYFDFKAGIYQGAFSPRYKGVVDTHHDGTRSARTPEPAKNAEKAHETAIADVKDIWHKSQWGRPEIDARDSEVKQALFDFFKNQLGL